MTFWGDCGIISLKDMEKEYSSTLLHSLANEIVWRKDCKNAEDNKVKDEMKVWLKNRADFFMNEMKDDLIAFGEILKETERNMELKERLVENELVLTCDSWTTKNHWSSFSVRCYGEVCEIHCGIFVLRFITQMLHDEKTIEVMAKYCKLFETTDSLIDLYPNNTLGVERKDDETSTPFEKYVETLWTCDNYVSGNANMLRRRMKQTDEGIDVLLPKRIAKICEVAKELYIHEPEWRQKVCLR